DGGAEPTLRRRLPPPKPKPKPKKSKAHKAKPKAHKPRRTRKPVVSSRAIFPVAGPYSFGGAGSRFGAGRVGHIHQGQDIAAAEGTPVVAPRSGTILWRAYQTGGAGNYLVLRASDRHDYVFMHLRTGSLRVARGATVRAGQVLGQVGMTGDATGPHLHFEVWVGGWQSGSGHAIDPLPLLETWRHL